MNLDAQTSRRRKNSLVLQGSILAIAALIVRLIGFFYRIPLVDILLDEGNGYYTSAFIIYTFFLMVSTYGFPAAISKMTSEKFAEKKYREAHSIFRSAFFLAIILGIVFSLVLWFGADTLAIISGGSKNSSLAIQATVPALFFFSILSVYRGYFQGMNTMVPTAVSQIFEQIFNAGFSLLLALLLVKKGLVYGAAGSVLGTGIGALSALLFLMFIYSITNKKIIRRNLKKDKSPYIKKSMFHYWKQIFMVSIPIVIGTAIFNLTSVIDMFMFKRAIIFHGNTVQYAESLFGVYAAKNQLLINLPVTIGAALSVASIPSISASVAQNNIKEVREKIHSAIRATILVVIPAAIGELVMAGPIIHMLFRTGDLALATRLLQIASISIIFFGLSTVSVGLLQGLGKLRMQIWTASIALIVKVILNVFLLYVFNLNIYGAVIANNLFSIVYALLNLYMVHRFVPVRIDFYHTIAKPLISAIFMGITCYILYYLLGILSVNGTLATLIAILISIFVYSIILLKLKGLSEKEIIDFPKGLKILKFLKKLRLI